MVVVVGVVVVVVVVVEAMVVVVVVVVVVVGIVVATVVVGLGMHLTPAASVGLKGNEREKVVYEFFLLVCCARCI